MAYATADDLIERYGEEELIRLTDRTGSGVADADTVARALSDADAEIDGYLASRYALPLQSVPNVLVRIACDIARYRLWADRASDEVRRRYEDARRYLESLSRGDVTLGLPPDMQPSAPTAMAAAWVGNEPVFTRQGTNGY